MNLPNLKQNIDGILLVNKPIGLTSNAVLQQVKRLFGAKKAGHTGSLDPLATGMLPVCFGEATKFCQFLLDADKSYQATGLLGLKTDTADAMGEVIARAEGFVVSVDDLHTALAEFRGKIQQVPSMYSALKHQGKPLYKYARAGVDIERQARDVFIHHLELNQFDGQSFSITVSCSKGTYIRNLVEDIGDNLGVGAHVTKLHRLYTAGLANEPMYTIDALQELSNDALIACLLPIDRAVNDLPRISLSTEAIALLRQGKRVADIASSERLGLVRLYENETDFMGLGELDGAGFIKVKRLLSFEA